jgi:hypothetical protein
VEPNFGVSGKLAAETNEVRKMEQQVLDVVLAWGLGGLQEEGFTGCGVMMHSCCHWLEWR